MRTLFKSSDEVVKEIHNAFDTAQEKLLAEAKQILSKQESNVGELCKTLGFINTPSAINHSLIKGEKEKATETARLVEYYKQNYPFQKFLTEDQLNQICEKYGLIHAPVKNYVKEVPEKNLREIANAKPLVASDSEGASRKYTFEVRHNHQRREFDDFTAMFGNVFTEKEIDDLYEKYCDYVPSHGTKYTDVVYYVTHNTKLFSGYAFADCEIETIDKTGLFIAAPQSHFNLDGLSKKNKFGFFSVTVKEVKDPVVFRYVKGGVQVLSKWGIEAEDSILQNPIEN